jgi:hypothetical protein
MKIVITTQIICELKAFKTALTMFLNGKKKFVVDGASADIIIGCGQKLRVRKMMVVD